jgi:hypothetical protein
MRWQDAALQNFDQAYDRSGSFSTEATARLGKQVDIGCWPDSSGPFHRRRFVGQSTSGLMHRNKGRAWICFIRLPRRRARAAWEEW